MPNVTETPEVRFDKDRRKVTTYRDASNASVELVQPTYQRFKTSSRLHGITFSDANETIQLLDAHAYTEQPLAQASRKEGESVEVNAGNGLSNDFSVTCVGDNARRKVNVSANVADSVMRERVQGFARRHPELAATIGTLELSIGKFSGYDIPVAELLTTPTQFRACPPERKGEGIVVEKLTR